jgi:hypothetical protein
MDKRSYETFTTNESGIATVSTDGKILECCPAKARRFLGIAALVSEDLAT